MIISAAPPSPQPPPATPPPTRVPWPFGKFPAAGRKRTLIIIGAIIIGAIAIGVILAVTFAQQDERRTSDFGPKVTFIKFEAERQEIRVGQNTSILFNVQNTEDRVIDDARVVVTVEPQVGNSYLSISNSTTDLPTLNTDARTGEIEVTITATGTPAREAVYDIKGILVAQETRTDVREFQLTIRQ